MKSAWRFLLVVFVITPGIRATPVDVLLVASDDITLQPLLGALSGTQKEVTASWTRWLGKLHGKSVVLTRTEGDPLNAVAATTLAVRLHPPRLILVFGTSRAHDPALRPGDVVISERFAAFDGMISPVTNLGGGSDALKWIKRPHPMMSTSEREVPTEFFPADQAALTLAQTLRPASGRVVIGTLGSAHQVNREADRIAKLRELWQTSTEDGESAHVAGVAALFKIPVIGIRVVAGSPTEPAELVSRFIEAWK